MKSSPSRSLVLYSYFEYVAVLLIVSLFLWAIGVPGFLITAEAAQLSNFSDSLSISKPNTPADHTIEFTTPTGVPADGTTIEVTIPDGFTMATLVEDDVDIEDDGVDITTDTVCGAVGAAITVAGQVITIEICNGGGASIDAGSIVTIEIGSIATFDGTGSHRITNHASTGSYVVQVGGTMTDDGSTRIVVIESVTVSGDVDNFFDFSISGVDAGLAINGDTTLTTGTTTATSVPFGLLTPATEYVLGQTLSVITNSANGFMVTVYADGDLRSPSGATINSYADGSGQVAPLIWAPPSAQYVDPDTYGHWGVTTEDSSLSDDDSFGSALFSGAFIQTPREVMFATSSADGATAHIGRTRVAYKLEISALQEAASDYSTTLTYIATPIF
jgi:hypothetical protein